MPGVIAARLRHIGHLFEENLVALRAGPVAFPSSWWGLAAARDAQ